MSSDDRMDFRVRALGHRAASNVQVGEESVRLEVSLPWLLQKFGEAVQKTISGRGRILLEKKKAYDRLALLSQKVANKRDDNQLVGGINFI